MAQHGEHDTKIDLLNRGSFVDRMFRIVNLLSDDENDCEAINSAGGSGKLVVLHESEWGSKQRKC